MTLSDAPIWPSAHKHGVQDADIRHALDTFIATAEDPRDDAVTLFLGFDRAGNRIEVGVLDTDDGPAIIHAMRARIARFFPNRG